MLSSLNMISEAEHTFHTAFQDHQYKVTNSLPVALLKPAVLELKQKALKRGSFASCHVLNVTSCLLSTGVHDPPAPRQRVSAVHGQNL